MARRWDIRIRVQVTARPDELDKDPAPVVGSFVMTFNYPTPIQEAPVFILIFFALILLGSSLRWWRWACEDFSHHKIFQGWVFLIGSLVWMALAGSLAFVAAT